MTLDGQDLLKMMIVTELFRHGQEEKLPAFVAETLRMVKPIPLKAIMQFAVFKTRADDPLEPIS